jgi:heme exporter protein C
MRRILLGFVLVLMLASMWIALMLGAVQGPPANPQSPVRNIIYFHVPSSICALFCFVVLLVGSVGYLATSKPGWDIVAAASAEVGTIFAVILNVTGSIFSRAEWNIWWTPSPRLVSAAILLFLYIVYLILRSSLVTSPHRKARICAVFGIIAFVDVPMVIISARFIPDIHKPSFSFTSSWQSIAFMLSMVATIFLGSLMIAMRANVLKIKAELDEQTFS